MLSVLALQLFSMSGRRSESSSEEPSRVWRTVVTSSRVTFTRQEAEYSPFSLEQRMVTLPSATAVTVPLKGSTRAMAVSSLAQDQLCPLMERALP